MSVSKKYIQNKIVKEDAGLGTIAAGQAIGAGVAAAVPLAFGMIYAFKDSIANIYRRYQWDKQGCDRELDPDRKAQCKIRLKNKYIAAYSRERSKCNKAKDPQACVASFNKKIATLEGQVEDQQNYRGY